MEKHYCFAGVEITVRIPEPWMFSEERELAAFRVDAVKEPHVFSFQPVGKLSPPPEDFVLLLPGMRVYREKDCQVRYIGTVQDGWESAYIRAEFRDRHHTVQVKISESVTGIGVKTVLNSLGAEHLVAENGGFVFHCSYIEWEGKAILFTAPSGTGKSTQADLWHTCRGAQIINGDRAVVRVVDGVPVAEGIPYAGSSVYCKNNSLPIRAIVYLAQAKETAVRRIRGYEAFSRIWEGVSVNTWDARDMERVSAAVQETAGRTPVFYMPCTPDETAVKALEDALRKLDES